jgi:hypothetical protein
VFTDDPVVVLIAVEFVRHDIAQQLIVEHFGLDKVNSFWRGNPAFAKLETGRGAPGLQPEGLPVRRKAVASPANARRRG